MVERLIAERDRIRAEHVRTARTLERLDTVIGEARSRVGSNAA